MEIGELSPDQMLIDAVVTALKNAEDLDLSLSAPAQTSVKRMDGTYRTKPLVGNETFTLKGIREGKRASYIFEFEPVDARDFTLAEFPDDRVFQVFAGLEEAAVKALGYEGIPWKQATAKFRTAKRREQAKIQRQEEKKAEVEAENHYKNDPLWGAWG